MSDSPAEGPAPDDTLLLTARRFRVVMTEQQLESGVTDRREIVRHPGSVVILPLVDERRVCLIRNYRVAVGKTLVELPAGTLEPGEPIEKCAHRELLEETGYRAGQMQRLTSFYPAPGILDEQMHLFLARQLTAGPPQREPTEQIENQLIDWDEAIRLIRQQEIDDAKTILAFLFYQMFYRNASI